MPPTELLIRDAELVSRPPGHPARPLEPIDWDREVERRRQPAGVLDLDAGAAIGHVAHDAIDDIEPSVELDPSGLQRRNTRKFSSVVHDREGRGNFLIELESIAG